MFITLKKISFYFSNLKKKIFEELFEVTEVIIMPTLIAQNRYKELDIILCVFSLKGLSMINLLETNT